ncbi:MAG: HAMP domain-containing sensor histidine kinase [Chloroflexota bacterium]
MNLNRPGLIWIPPFIPLLLALIAAYFMRSQGRINISITFFDVVLWLGAALTILWLLVTYLRWQHAKAALQIEEKVFESAVVDRRRFLQRLDHELKNPLMAIRALLDDAMSRDSQGEANDGSDELLGSVNAQVKRLSRLVTDLRKVSDLETLPLEIGPVDLDLLLRDAFALLEEHPEAPNRRLLLVIPEAPWPLPTISGDWDLLYLALYNLLENGIKYSKQGSSIEVKAREADSKIYIDVADSGIGISEADLPYIWDELYRAEQTRGVSGSGLGLALTRAIIQRHGGSISADSRLGQGTVISVELPVTINLD